MSTKIRERIEDIFLDPGVQGLLLLLVIGVLILPTIGIDVFVIASGVGFITLVYFAVRFIRAIERIADGIEELAGEQDENQSQ